VNEVRRNQWGQYCVVPPKGGREKGYRRVTTVAKALDSSDALIPWKATMAIVGQHARPGLAARWQALMARTGNDPWYFDEASKAEAKRLVEECAEAGGSSNRADIGTALHSITELLDRGELDRSTLLPGVAADLDAYERTMDAAGLKRVAGWVELCLVLDDHQVAGTADRGLVVAGDTAVKLPTGRVVEIGAGEAVVGDLKTGTSVELSMRSIAIQLAAYANANARYHYGADAKSDRREDPPGWRKDVGVVIHLPAGSGSCALHWVDLVDGWDAFERSCWVFDWRKAKLSVPFDLEVPPPVAATPTISQPASPRSRGEGVPAPTSLIAQALAASASTAGVSCTPDGTPPAAEPADPFQGLTAEEPTPAPRRTFDPAPPRPRRDVIHEGPNAAAILLEQFKEAWAQLDEASMSWIKALAEQGHAADRPFSVSQLPSVRRVAIARALVALARAGCDTDEILVALLTVALGEEPQASIPPGAVVGALTIDQAHRLAALAQQIGTDALVVQLDLEGRHTLTGPALAAVG
jgi:hypothetical protein